MNKLNCEEKTALLQQRVLELELALKKNREELDHCLQQNLEENQQTKSEEATDKQQALEKEQQYTLFTHYKICDANWSLIPENFSPTSIHMKEAEKIPAFLMLNTPVTFEMFDLYCAATGQQPPGDEGWGRENRPVIHVNYQDALTYTLWLSEQTGWICRLPTEEQWEYACRAKTVTHYWYGDIPDPRMMVMGTGKSMPTPGSRLANPWDLYDMHGNVWEWTSTVKGDEYILCGGSWYNKANWLTSSARNISYPDFSNNNWGFRIIRCLDQEQ